VYKTYLVWLMVPLLLASMAIIGLDLWLEPLVGDLTRIGGYPENDYGWRGTQERFTPPLADEITDPDGRYDILVFGDSFSRVITPDQQARAGSHWVDFLAQQTGLSVGVVDRYRHSLATYLTSIAYQQDPPKVLIFESVERAPIEEIDKPECNRSDIRPRPLMLSPRRVEPEQFRRRTAIDFSKYYAVSPALDFLAKAMSRTLDDPKTWPVLRLPLTRNDLFTSRNSGDLLVYPKDLLKAGWTDAEWTGMGCQLLELQALAEANGRTRFLVVIAPDKSSAYAGVLAQPIGMVSGTERLSKVNGLRLPRVDLALKAAIVAGAVDVYLPDDTHWGAAGARIAAQTVVHALEVQFATVPVR
jgi:hypothetical protein